MKESKYNVGDLIYDANIYDGMNVSLIDLQFYLKWLPENKKKRILELCCGTGRLTIPISKERFNITGLDFTNSMLKSAKEKAFLEGLNIEFIESDIRTFKLQNKFDFIFIPFNSIHHLYSNDDLLMTLNNVKNHLRKGGLFLFDCFNPNIQYIVENENHLNKIAEFKTKDGRNVLIKQKMEYESLSQINRIEWHYYINGLFDSIQNMDMRMFFPQELDFYLKSSGFNIIHKYGGFNQEEFNSSSEKQIFVCKYL